MWDKMAIRRNKLKILLQEWAGVGRSYKNSLIYGYWGDIGLGLDLVLSYMEKPRVNTDTTAMI